MLRVVGLCALVALALAQAQQPRFQEPVEQVGGAAPAKQQSPITRVTNMLKDMQANCEKEGKEDEKLNIKMDCWCNTNEKEQTAKLNDANANIESATALSEKGSAAAAAALADIATLQKEMDASQKVVADQTAQREKQAADFAGLSSSLNGSIDQLSRAIKTLSGAQGRGSFLQVSSELEHMPTFNSYQMQLHSDLLSMLAAYPVKENLRGAEQKKVALQQVAPNSASYSGASGAIFGIINQMKEGMEKDLSEAESNESNSQAAFNKLVAAKNGQVAAANTNRLQRHEDKSAGLMQQANADNDLQNAERSANEATTFLADLKAKCDKFDKEYAARVANRNGEIEAIGEALKILTDDESRALFGRTDAVQFLQEATSMESRRKRAMKYVMKQALKQKNMELMQIAAELGTKGAFDKVLGLMDDMRATLKEEQENEYQTRNDCIETLRTTENQKDDNQNNLDDANAESENQQKTMETLDGEIKTTKEQVAEARRSIKVAGEQRAEQNKAYQTEVKDQRATASILNRVLKKLQSFYARQSLIQQPAGYDQGKRSVSPESGGVMVMIQSIIKDAEHGAAKAIEGEQDLQSEYAAFLADNNEAVTNGLRAISDKESQRGKAGADKADADSKADDATVALGESLKVLADTHGKCDFLLKNYEVRQEQRTAEIESIEVAKGILRGSSQS